VTLIKGLKVRGTSSVLKMGNKIKQIRIVDGDHDIDCKTDLGPMMLKSGFLRNHKMKIASIFWKPRCFYATFRALIIPHRSFAER